MLLEVLLALLIFSLGVLGLVGLQANAVKQSGQTKFRSDATLLANELIGEMWVDNRSFTALSAKFASQPAGDGYNAWAARVSQTLPGGLAPIVALSKNDPLSTWTEAGPSGVSDATLSSSTKVTITLLWKLPSEPAGDAAHQLVTVTEIK